MGLSVSGLFGVDMLDLWAVYSSSLCFEVEMLMVLMVSSVWLVKIAGVHGGE
jgi:hypothetical protein